jgi:hypothetical protein
VLHPCIYPHVSTPLRGLLKSQLGGGGIRPGLGGKSHGIPDHSKLPLHIYRTNFEPFQQYLGSEMINLDPDPTFQAIPDPNHDPALDLTPKQDQVPVKNFKCTKNSCSKNLKAFFLAFLRKYVFYQGGP